MKQLLSSVLLLTLFSLFTMNADSQSNRNYEKEWKKVEEFQKQNLPKSAIAEVKNIYTMAKKANQDAQVIKTLVYLSFLQESIRENNDALSIKEIEKEIPGSKEPATSLLNSLLASVYWNYYQQHRWEFYNRTQTVNFKKEDIATWTAEDFHKKVSELYLKSVSNKKLLQQTKLQPYDAIIEKGNVRHLRPTLFDLLANQALQYFENDERDINKPAYAFEIDQAAAFDPAADFARFKFVTKDSLSLQLKALQLYQDLIAFHLNDAKPDALIDADINRIEFVNRQSVHPDKNELYFNAINHIAHQYGNLPAASTAWFMLANYYFQRAAGYKPFEDTSHRYDFVKAKEICERVIAQKDSSEGKVACMNLLKGITRSYLHFEVEKVNSPGQPFRALVNYKNLSEVHLKIVKASDFPNLENIRQSSDEKYWTDLFQAKAVRSWTQTLPVTGDYQQHAVEIKIDALPSDEYILLASSDKVFNYKKGVGGMNVFYVSPISYINDQQDVFVLNRETGQPLANAAVQVWEQTYDYTTSKYTRQKAKLYKTDANGYIHTDRKIDEKNRYNYSYYFEITHSNEKLFIKDLMNDYYSYQSPDLVKTVNSAFLFTDRSIYRPGQTVYFKAILLSRNSVSKKANILTGFTTTLYLRDANGQLVDSVKLTSNEFGSFSGKFQLPQSGLNGQFSINAKDLGTTSFNVEEYKRPKFYVEYDPLKGAYKVNDKIKITGTAKAYAGNNIDGATVSYRVIRQPRFLYPWMFKRWWQPPTEPLEIVHGVAKTDKDGKFSVEFTAIPDMKIDKKLDPVFDYIIYADITDINGETRSGEQSVTVGYKSLLIKSNIPSSQLIDSIRTWPIRTENMNGQFEPASITVKVIRLKEEKRLIRSRYWQRPDQYVMTKDEYIKLFPYDEYADESDPESWEKGETVFEKTDSSRSNGQWPVRELAGGQASRFLPGYYLVEITTKDKSGQEVKDVRYIELYDNTSPLTKPQYLWSGTLDPIEPGETKTVNLATSADNVFVIQQVKNGISDQQQSRFSFVRLNQEKKGINFTATEDDRGGYGVNWVFVKHNRVYRDGKVVTIPWSNKELKIEYATYRDKTLPGSEEKWKLKISGYKNEKVAAEMLASMYDASLDQFQPHNWNVPNIWPNYYSSSGWTSGHNFAGKNSADKYVPYESKEVVKVYDELIWPDYGSRLRSFNAPSIREEALAAGRVPLAYEPVANAQLKSEKRNFQRGNVIDYFDKGQGDTDGDGAADQFDAPKPVGPSGEVQVRKNFNETAFFLPDLKTDSEGNIEFSFTMPEALTRWKFQALAHTKELAFGLSTKEIVTQKQLMVQPNAPRFIREGDKMEFSSKVVNLTEKEMTGQATLQLIDASTNQPLDSWFKNTSPVQYFTVAPGQSEAVKFSIEIPYQFNKALIWRIVARAADFSDGEENALPVLTNRMLVTETLPLNVRGNGTKDFTFDKLLQSGKSETLQHYGITVEYTSNPAWYAVQALPYLMEYPYECAEQNWNRYYANSLGAYIANSSPRIRQVFEQWKIRDTAALLSNLQKNQELKAILLEETPWVLQAKNEAEQKKNLALLFDMVRMSNELNGTFEKLKQMQSSNGGFVWFKGGPDDRYITQYIVTGIGHLKKLNGIAKGQEEKLKQILSTAIPYLDKKLKEDYDNLVKSKSDRSKYVPAYNEIYYLYMRSFFPEYKIPAATQTAYNFFRQRAQQSWTTQNKYMQGMLALALHRTGDTKTPAAILKSLKETSITNEELGMYWKDARRGWWWYEAPVERQALLIEAFQEIGKDTKTVDDLKTWLLKNKQTNSWESTKATAEACYALLLQGTQWLTNAPAVEVDLGPAIVKTTGDEEAGTGYLKKTIEGRLVTPEMGNIKVNVQSTGTQTSTSWGAVYWQYFENLDKITTAATPLSLTKKLFVEKNTDRGPALSPVNDGDYLKVGDKIKVRIELRADRDMEYVHMKDMRASCMEPVNVLSSYKWQGGLGYYETTKDASTSFFFNSLRKGTYVFEYTLFVTHTGNFSNGVTTIQCMYAPEFSSHSEGIRVNVE